MLKLLLADHAVGFRQAVGGLLRAHFPTIELREAGDGPETLQQLDGADVVFLDFSLHRELAAKIKSEHPTLVLAMLTIHDAPEYRQAAFRQGADYFVSKGAPAEQVLKVVRSVVTGKKAATARETSGRDNDV
ncbi:MAG: response regulator [Gammaproteobacteria bacterium]